MKPKGAPVAVLSFQEVMSAPVDPQAASSLKDLPGLITEGSRSLWQ